MSKTRRRVTTSHRATIATCALTGRPVESRDAIVRMSGLGFEALVLADPFFEKFVNPLVRARLNLCCIATTRNQRARLIPGLKPVTGRVRTDRYEFNLQDFVRHAPARMVTEFYEKLGNGTLGELFESSSGLAQFLDANSRPPRKSDSAA